VTFLALAIGCTGTDYGVARPAQVNPGADRPVDLAFDVAFQELGYGNHTSRCQVQVAFSPLDDTATTMPRTAGPPPPPATEIAFPDTPGTCAFSELERPDGETGGDPGGEPGQGDASVGEPGDGGRDPGDADPDGWQVSGTVVGPGAVWMRHDNGDLLLETAEIGDGGLRYELPDCDADRFPFSTTLGLDVPDADDPDGVHAFAVPELVAVGPRVIIDAPGLLDGDLPHHDPVDPLPIRWTLDGPDPTINGAPLSPSVRIQMLSQQRGGQEGEPPAADRWLVCWPDEEGWFDVDPADLAPLVEGRDDPTQWSTQIAIHTEVLGPEQVTPWGRTVQVRAHVSADGGIDLTPD
jgi:hypothetical protein